MLTNDDDDLVQFQDVRARSAGRPEARGGRSIAHRLTRTETRQRAAGGGG